MARAKRKKRKDGRFADYVYLGIKPDGTEDRKWAYAYTEKELDQKLLEIEIAASKGEILKDENITIREWGELWLKTYKLGKEYKTYQMYEITLKHIYDDLGHIKLKDLKPIHVQGLINSRRAKGLTKTLKNIKLTLNQMVEQAIENELMIKNPVKRIELPSIEKADKRALTDDEVKLLSEADFTAKERAFIYICLYAGLRRGEALALTKKDIDFKEGKINVRNVIVFKNNQPQLKTYTKTEAGKREVPIVNKLRPVLEFHMNVVKGIYLFQPQTSKGLMTETAFRSMWKVIWNKMNRAAGGGIKTVVSEVTKKKTKVKIDAIETDITPHMLRHTYATMLYYAGVDLKQAQYLLGHSSADVTLNTYTHLDNKKSAPTDKLNAYLA